MQLTPHTENGVVGAEIMFLKPLNVRSVILYSKNALNSYTPLERVSNRFLKKMRVILWETACRVGFCGEGQGRALFFDALAHTAFVPSPYWKVALLLPALLASIEGASWLSAATPMSEFAKGAIPSPSSLRYKDYSSTGSQYLPLKGIELKASTVKFVGSEKTHVLGTSLDFQKFEVVAPVSVQTSCSVAYGTFDTALGRYAVAVARDTKDAARRDFLRQIKSYWKAEEAEEPNDYQDMPARKFLWMNTGRYVLYLQPEEDLEGATHFLYTSGKVIRLTFQGYQLGDGWGGVSTFLDENLLLRFSNTQIRCRETPQVSPTQFWAWDKRGYFDKPPAI